MLSAEQRDLLDLPAFAKLVTLMPDGHPQGTVMWYRREGDSLRMIAPASAVKVGNLERDPRSTVIVDHPEIGYTYVELRCRAEVVQDDAAAREELYRVARRYVGDEEATRYVGRLSAAPRVMLVFHPIRVQGQFRNR